MNPKRVIGQVLFDSCRVCPTLKPLLRNYGLRTTPEWFSGRVISLKINSWDTLRLAGIESNYLTFELFWKGLTYYEPITMMLARELARSASTFVDAGANIGLYSLVLGRTNPQLRVLAFEPNPRMFELLQKNVMLNHAANTKCVPLALSDHAGTVSLFLSQSDMSASLEADFESGTTPTFISAVTLDEYLLHQPVDGEVLIKIDVEGHEPAVFRGAQAFLKHRKPDILCEVTGPMDPAVASLLARFGYRFYQITDEGLIPAMEMNLVVRNRLLFLNYLLSAKPPQEVAARFEAIAPEVRKIDLSKTSKNVTPEHIRKLESRCLSLQQRQTAVLIGSHGSESPGAIPQP